MSETRVHDGREFTVRNLDEEPLTPKEQRLHFRVEKMNAEQDEGKQNT